MRSTSELMKNWKATRRPRTTPTRTGRRVRRRISSSKQSTMSGGTATRANITDTEATFSFGVSTGNIKFREWTGSAAYAAVYMGLGGTAPNNANYALVGSSSDLLVNAPSASGTLYLRTGNSDRATITSSYVEVVPASLRFRSGIASPVIGQDVHATTPQPLYLTAGNVTTGTGGDVNVSPGSGSVASGNLNLRMGGTAGPIALQISPTGITETRVAGMAPPAAAPSSGTVYRYVSNGEAACPAPADALVLEDHNGAYWHASKKVAGLVNTATFTMDLARLPIPPTGAAAKFNLMSGKLRIAIINPASTGGTTALKGHAEYAWDAFADADSTYAHIYLQTLFGGAVTTPTIALTGSPATGSIVTITVTGTSALTADYMVICEGAATWR